MEIIKKARDLTTRLRKIRSGGATIGFVPTMGALHTGHISLLQKSREICDNTVCSIFINPTQFTNPDDLKKYPVTPEQDIYTLEKNNCDILFLPDVTEIYPDGTVMHEHFDLGYLENILEGKYRPGHFQGVCQVVKRLLGIIEPTHLFLGQKDYQQCMVIKRLMEMEKLKIHLIICPTLREKNGLAMSSRNLRLSVQQKQEAGAIYATLLLINQKIKPGLLDKLKKDGEKYLIKNNIRPDYVEIADAADLKQVTEWNGRDKLVAVIAAFVGEVRLIDNMLLKDQRDSIRNL